MYFIRKIDNNFSPVRMKTNLIFNWLDYFIYFFFKIKRKYLEGEQHPVAAPLILMITIILPKPNPYYESSYQNLCRSLCPFTSMQSATSQYYRHEQLCMASYTCISSSVSAVDSEFWSLKFVQVIRLHV